mmetsp:Transcript_10854/g.25223  ORF Transcript_10854/g.25223 Transcript_10854/m.25223 type:complete len:1024 (-) Transcript_10854:191-3262(-)
MFSWRQDGAITGSNIMNAAAKADELLGNDEEDEREEEEEATSERRFTPGGSPGSPPGGSLLAQYHAHNAAHLKKMKADLEKLDNELAMVTFKKSKAKQIQHRAKVMARAEVPHHVNYKFGGPKGEGSKNFTQPWLERIDLSGSSQSSSQKNNTIGAKSKATLGKTTMLTVRRGENDHGGDAGDAILPQLSELTSVFRYLEVLDISGNQMSKTGVVSLKEFLGKRECHVVSLKADHANLSDGAGASLLSCLKENVSLRKIHLAHNCLKHKAMQVLGDGLEDNNTLTSITLSWNNVFGVGLQALANGLAVNKGLKKLDLSWNLLGRLEEEAGASAEIPRDAMRAFADALGTNRTLVLLDLSNCSLDIDLCGILGKGLAHNNSIFGLHFIGNKATTDAKGFLRLDIATEDLTTEDIKDQGESSFCGQCWDQHKWVEHRFTFTAGHSGPVDPQSRDPVYVHLMLDDWKPDNMSVERIFPKRNQKDAVGARAGPGEQQQGGEVTYKLSRMLPPGRVWYFFSQQGRVLCACDQLMANHPRFHVPRNFVDIEPREGRLKANLVMSQPRLHGWVSMPEDVLSSMRVSRPEWDVLHSIYASRGQNNAGRFLDEDAVSDALRTDLGLTKLLAMRLVDEAEMEVLRGVLEENSSGCEYASGSIYKSIVTLYRWYGPQECHSHDDSFTISWTECVKFVTDSGICKPWEGPPGSEKELGADERSMKDLQAGEISLPMIWKEYMIVNVELEAEADNDDDTLARFELLELILRIAALKYIATRRVKSKKNRMAEAIVLLNEECLQPYMLAQNIESPDRVRMKTFYKEDVCLAIESKRKHIQRVFTDHCSTVNNLNGQYRMQLKDFLALFKHAGLYDKWFTMGDARVVFVMSILITENELTSNEHKELDFVDFLEACVRTVYIRAMRQNDKTRLRHIVPQFVSDLIHALYNEGFDGQLVPKRKKKNGVAEAKAMAEKAQKKANRQQQRTQAASDKKSGRKPRTLAKLSMVRPEILMTPVKKRQSILGSKPVDKGEIGSR